MVPRSRGRGFGRIARTLIAVQVLTAIALPIALCRWLEMMAEAAVHGGPVHGGHHGDGRETSACPHHAPRSAPESDETTPACCGLVPLVLMLSGLLGVPEGTFHVVTVLPHADASPGAARGPIDTFPAVESPPPRV